MALERLVAFVSGFSSTGAIVQQDVSAANPLPVTLSGGGGGGIVPVEGAPSTTMGVSQVAVTAAATQILAANSARLGASIVNTGPATVFIGETNAVTAAAGYPVPPNTAFNIDIPLYTGAVFGICAATLTATVGVEEMTA